MKRHLTDTMTGNRNQAENRHQSGNRNADTLTRRIALLAWASPAVLASPAARWAVNLIILAGAALLVWSGVLHLQLWGDGYRSISVNGQSQTPSIENGYVAIRRAWKKGDRIVLDLPMSIQRITADKRIEADRGRVALRYGPLLYNVETADHQDINKAIGTGPLSLEWKGDLLHGVMVIKGAWADGTPLLAIPNYARLNRAGTTPYPQEAADRAPASIVWIKQ